MRAFCSLSFRSVCVSLTLVLATYGRLEISGAAQPGQELWSFTFGTPDSVTRTGFTKVIVKDAFDPDKGYGFASTQDLEAFDRGGMSTQAQRPTN